MTHGSLANAVGADIWYPCLEATAIARGQNQTGISLPTNHGFIETTRVILKASYLDVGQSCRVNRRW